MSTANPIREDNPDANTLKVLIATDNHLGYLEEDPVRGQDSFNAFEEILQLAQHHNVDFILLGGDLFHHNKPSRSCLFQVMRLIRRFCFGDKPSQVWIASDQSVNFADGFCTANYLDPNMNISYPIFSIHGNHDDPSGMGNLSALNLLSVTGLVNYFGKCHNLNELTLSPILMQKGDTRLALYGLGSVRDERLHRAWRDQRVKFVRPADGTDWQDAFNLFVLHQNRAKHGPTSHIPEEFLDSFLDLVFWGHEHECRIHPEPSCDKTYITQPGSSVATSLSEGEAISKHVGLLKITGRNYMLDKIRLTTVRPFQFTSVALANVPELSPTDTKRCQAYLKRVVEDLIAKAEEEWSTQEGQREPRESQVSSAMPLPLIRVRVDYGGGFETFNPQQFGQQFSGRVANPKDILKFQRTRVPGGRKQKPSEILMDVNAAIPERLDRLKVEDLVSEILSRDLELLAENELEDAVKKFVDKDERDAIVQFVQQSIARTQHNIPPSQDLSILSDDFIKQRSQTSKQHRVEAYAREHAGMTASTHQQNTTATSAAALIKKRRRDEPEEESEEGEEDTPRASHARRCRMDSHATPPQPVTARGRRRRSGTLGHTDVPQVGQVCEAVELQDQADTAPSTEAAIRASVNEEDDDLFSSFAEEVVRAPRRRRLPGTRH